MILGDGEGEKIDGDFANWRARPQGAQSGPSPKWFKPKKVWGEQLSS